MEPTDGVVKVPGKAGFWVHIAISALTAIVTVLAGVPALGKVVVILQTALDALRALLGG